MTDMRFNALKNTALALLIAILFVALFALSPRIGFLAFLFSVVGFGTYFASLEWEKEKIRIGKYNKEVDDQKADYEKNRAEHRNKH